MAELMTDKPVRIAVYDTVPEAHLGRAGPQQGREHVGLVTGEEPVEPGEEGVAVADLGGAAAIPLEGLVGRGGHGSGVALKHGDPVPGPAQLHGDGQPRHPSTDDHDLRHAIRNVPWLSR